MKKYIQQNDFFAVAISDNIMDDINEGFATIEEHTQCINKFDETLLFHKLKLVSVKDKAPQILVATRETTFNLIERLKNLQDLDATIRCACEHLELLIHTEELRINMYLYSLVTTENKCRFIKDSEF